MSYQILNGDALTVLRSMPDESVHCCITSPPYYGLRDYGVDGQIGLEPTPEAFIARLVDIFREVRRVLRDDGTLWVNIGDSYATGAGKVGDCPSGGVQGENWKARYRGNHADDPKRAESAVRMGPMTQPNRMPLPGLKPKDLIGIPWMLAFALRTDGWWLRQDIIWAKPNPMPESVKDRCTKAHEYVFLLSKAERYFYDSDAIKEPGVAMSEHDATGQGYTAPGQTPQSGTRQKVPSGWDTKSGSHGTIHRAGRTERQRGHSRPHMGFNDRWDSLERSVQCGWMRNKRSIWTFATQPTPEAHFATFPVELPELCLSAGAPEGGLVLDPFAGAGTTGLACLKNGRRFLGIEINPRYVEIAYQRARKYYPVLLGAEAIA